MNFISQSRYTKDLLKWSSLENTKSYPTAMGTLIKLNNDKHEEKVDEKKYRGVIDFLLY